MSTAEPRRPEPAAEQRTGLPPAQSKPRRVPTPAELFARRPRPAAREELDTPELATGTG